MSRNILMISVANFKELTCTHTNTDEKLIRPELKAAQDIKIRELLGSILYDKILDLIATDTLKVIANVNYKNLVNNYLVDTLINYTLAELPDATSYQFTNKGVNQITGEGIQALDKSLLNSIKDKYKNRGDFYAERTRKFILANPGKYPEYTQYGGIDTTAPARKSYSCPFPIDASDIVIVPQPGYNSNDPIIF